MVNPDFNDLLCAFNDVEVRYLIVGAHAVAHHSRPRYTKDLDVWVEASPQNAQRVFAALAQFGAPLHDVTKEDFANPRTIFEIGVAPNRIAILCGLQAVDFERAWSQRTTGSFGDCTVSVLSREDLIKNKQSVARPQDLWDVESLKETQPRLHSRIASATRRNRSPPSEEEQSSEQAKCANARSPRKRRTATTPSGGGTSNVRTSRQREAARLRQHR